MINYRWFIFRRINNEEENTKNNHLDNGGYYGRKSYNRNFSLHSKLDIFNKEYVFYWNKNENNILNLSNVKNTINKEPIKKGPKGNLLSLFKYILAIAYGKAKKAEKIIVIKANLRSNIRPIIKDNFIIGLILDLRLALITIIFSAF